MALAPIAFFVYNRPKHAQMCLEALSQNVLADKSHLFIFADGPKAQASTEQKEAIKQTRLAIKEKKWCGEVDIVESETNKGLAKSIIDGVTFLTEKYGKVIVLEDDLLTGKYFLTYMNDGLDIYENEDKVVEIHGFMYNHKEKLPDTFFIRGADCWGWATWARAWKLFNPDGQFLLDEIKRQHLQSKFNFDNTYDYIEMLEGQIAGRNNSWAVRWLASAFLADRYTLYPSKSLVRNIGFDGSGTHCDGDNYLADMEIDNEPVKIIKTDDIRECGKAKKVFKKEFTGGHIVLTKTKRLVKRILKKIRWAICRK